MLAGLALAALAAAAPAAAQVGSWRIAEVRVQRANVFDPAVPGEDWWVFRWADRIHVVTLPPVVERELLLAPGVEYDPLKAIETERNLRALGFFRKASVVAVANSSGTVDLAVRTQDSWTLQPRMSFLTEGGKSSFVAGLAEGNLLGTGKSVSYFNAREGERRRNEVRYGDPRFAGTGNRMLGHFAATDRGDEFGAMVEHPFFSHETPWATQASWARVAQEEDLFKDGDQANQFLDDFRAVRALAAWRIPPIDDNVHRAGVGWRYERSRFSMLDQTLPGTLPSDRALSGPLVSYAFVQPRYLKATDADRMRVVEDFNLGWELGVEGGPLPKALGSDRDRWGLRSTLQKGLGAGEGRFGLVQAVADSRAVDGHLEDGILTGSLNLFWKTPFEYTQTLVTHGEYTATKNLDAERQLNLGGDTGLRGYKNDAFQGARVAVVNFEDRFFFPPDFFHLVYLGAAAFAEAGTAIPEGARFMGAPWKADAGLGLRLSPSRGSSGSVLRLDVAYALSRGPGGSRWVATIKGGQAFELGGSANRPLLRRPDAVLVEDSPNERLRRQ